MELNTYGDLKKVINAVSKQQKGEKIGQVALSTIIGVIPGAEVAKTTFDFIKAAFQKPDTKKTKTWLDKLDIDDEMSAIVDDTVENGFLQILAKTIENESDTKPLESDFNMNAKMVNYLKQTYSGRTISGIQENKMENKALKNLIKEEIKKILQEDTPIESKPEVKKLITYLTNAGRISLEQINTPQELDSLLNVIWDGMNDTMKKNSKAIAIKRIIDSKL
jgi:hypothetical protein